MSDPAPSGRWASCAGGLAVAVVTSALMVATEPGLSIVWDEGYTLGREARLRAWFRALGDPSRFSAAWPPEFGMLVQEERGWLRLAS